jgi:hypothetical protein
MSVLSTFYNPNDINVFPNITGGIIFSNDKLYACTNTQIKVLSIPTNLNNGPTITETINLNYGKIINFCFKTNKTDLMLLYANAIVEMSSFEVSSRNITVRLNTVENVKNTFSRKYSNNNFYYIANNAYIYEYQYSHTHGPYLKSNYFPDPVGLAIDSSDNLYVYDQNLYTISKFKSDKSYVENFITLQTGITLGNIMFDNNNNLYASYNINSINYIQIYSPTKVLIETITTTNITPDVIIGMTFDNLNNLYFCYNNSSIIMKYTPATPTTTSIPCFKEDTQILTIDGYKSIQNLRNGDLIKTFEHDYKPIVMIGKRDIYHPVLNERIKNQLYQCSQSEYPEIFKPLIITGCHSLLVDDFISEEQREKVIEINGDTFVTENKYRLPACVDHRATVYETAGTYTIYHLALENDNYYFNYGIYANGLLVETCSQRYLKELSEMTLFE